MKFFPAAARRTKIFLGRRHARRRGWAVPVAVVCGKLGLYVRAGGVFAVLLWVNTGHYSRTFLESSMWRHQPRPPRRRSEIFTRRGWGRALLNRSYLMQM